MREKIVVGVFARLCSVLMISVLLCCLILGTWIFEASIHSLEVQADGPVYPGNYIDSSGYWVCVRPPCQYALPGGGLNSAYDPWESYGSTQIVPRPSISIDGQNDYIDMPWAYLPPYSQWYSSETQNIPQDQLLYMESTIPGPDYVTPGQAPAPNLSIYAHQAQDYSQGVSQPQQLTSRGYFGPGYDSSWIPQ